MTMIPISKLAKYKVDMPNSRWRDYGGERFGMLTVVEPCGTKRFGQHEWWCRCDCGNLLKLPSGQLGTKTPTKSCGCLLTGPTPRHNLTGTPVHNRWKAMKRRCLGKNSSSFKRYGGKGVSIHPTWLVFENFYFDMGHPPTNDYELDRIDPSKGYAPDNCQWIERIEHRRKTARDRKLIRLAKGNFEKVVTTP